MELSKFYKKTFFSRDSHLCYADPRGSDELQINISLLNTFLIPNTGSFILPWHYSSLPRLKSYSKSQKLHSKAINSIMCSHDQVLHSSYLYHYISVCFVNSINVINTCFASISTLPIIKGVVYYYRNLCFILQNCVAWNTEMGFQ